MEAMTAKTAYLAVQSEVERIKNGDPETIATMSPGDVVRQGDIMIVALDKAPDRDGMYKGRQLAEGNTQGSRHVAEGDVDLYLGNENQVTKILNRLIPTTRGRDQLLGPCIHSEVTWTVTHPEHAHKTLPAGDYVVAFQRTPQNTRVQD